MTNNTTTNAAKNTTNNTKEMVSMTNTTIEMVINAGVTTAEEIFAFVMDKKNGVTVPMLEEALVEMMVAFKKKDTKETKASFFARALEMDMDDYSAADESSVAENTTTNQSEEEVTMTNTIKTTEEVMVDAMNKSLPTPSVGGRKDLGIYHEAGAHKDDSAVKEMMAKINAAKDAYLNNIGEHGIVVEAVDFYDERKIRKVKLQNGSMMHFVGEVIVRIPAGYAQIKVWNPTKPNNKGTLGAPEFIDFVGYDLNLAKRRYDMRRPLATGTGLVALSIYEFVSPEGETSGLQVSLPTEKGKDGTRYHIFQTNDIRFIKTKDADYKDQPLYVRDNNEQFNAQVTAFVQMYANEFVQADPANHHGFDKKYCSNMVRFGVKDGVMDDVDTESKKTRAILEQIDTTQLSRVGSEQPTTYCMVKDKWLDLEARMAINEAEQFERGVQARDEDGEERYQRHNEIVIGGKLVSRQEVIDAGIKKECANCPFYCGNSPKSDAQITKEKVEAAENGGGYVSPFFREKPKAKAQAVQTLIVNNSGSQEWVTKYPYQLLNDSYVQDILGVRVKSAGITVYGSDDVLAKMDPEYVVPVEAFDARHADTMKKINQIFHAAFNMAKYTPEQMELVFELAENKPEGLTDSESERWDNAVNWLAQALGWAAEREAARNIKPFATKFFMGEKEGAVELHIEDIMGDTLYRAETDQLGWGLGYDDLMATEFVRYLDEIAIDYVYDVITNGTEYTIVGGRELDKQLASGALQEMLQRELNYNWVRGARRDENPAQAVAEMKVAKEVKDYIAEVIGLKK